MSSRPLTALNRLWLLAIVLMTFLALPAQGQDQRKEQKVFELNISPNGYPPYLIVDGEEPAGIMWDVMKLIIPRMGYEVQAHKIPRKRVDQMLADGYIDGTPRAIQWTSEPEKFLFTDPVIHVEEVFFFPEHSKLEFQSIEDLKGKTIVAPLGYVYPTLGPYFNDGRINRFDVSNDRNMFRYLLHSKRFDAALADRLVGRWILKTEGIDERIRSSGKSVSRYGFRLMLRPDWTEFAEAFNKELATIRENGELDAILARYR